MAKKAGGKWGMYKTLPIAQREIAEQVLGQYAEQYNVAKLEKGSDGWFIKYGCGHKVKENKGRAVR